MIAMFVWTIGDVVEAILLLLAITVFVLIWLINRSVKRQVRKDKDLLEYLERKETDDEQD